MEHINGVLSALGIVLVGVVGCAGDLPKDLDGTGFVDTTFDLGNREISTVYACDTVDVLFVVDNSNTMTEEQQNLVASFPKLIEAIEGLSVRSYRVGVISSDIGAGTNIFKEGEEIRCQPDGDAGKLQNAPRGSACAVSYPKYLDSTQSLDMKKDFGCIAELGVTGCGFEQHLESARLALTQQPYNDGFLRDNAPLALIFIADEDDCSAQDPNKLFDPNDTNLSHIRTRCVSHPDMLYPVSRYVNIFRGLKDDPKRILVAAISGPKGTVKIDPTLPAGQEPACDSQEFGKITYGNRFVELVEAFGDFGVHVDLCQGDLTAGLERIGRIIRRACIN
jgi:hypothetical protein